ncbi:MULTISPECIES: hypothetical protein [unclassified Streptomyces]|uniref:AbiTii domain-containing protein n=1 Tax=unclassified Streptomyces TaxID=2593676 RepID=UPI0036A5A190
MPIPDYRRFSAPLVMDGLAGRFQFREQPVSMFVLPDFARESLGDVLRLGQGVGQLESLIARQPGQTLQLAPAMAAEVAVFMSQNSSRQVLRLYWAVHPSAMEGVLDQVCTQLVQLSRGTAGRHASGSARPDTAPGRSGTPEHQRRHRRQLLRDRHGARCSRAPTRNSTCRERRNGAADLPAEVGRGNRLGRPCDGSRGGRLGDVVLTQHGPERRCDAQGRTRRPGAHG